MVLNWFSTELHVSSDQVRGISTCSSLTRAVAWMLVFYIAGSPRIFIKEGNFFQRKNIWEHWSRWSLGSRSVLRCPVFMLFSKFSRLMKESHIFYHLTFCLTRIPRLIKMSVQHIHSTINFAHKCSIWPRIISSKRVSI